jgi:Cof subfamily protein (haloacid dehalogenase superfamily)
MADITALQKLKIVVFDLDGTLLSDNGTIGENTKNLIRKLREYNVRFTFATGRLHSAITFFAEELDLKVPLVSLDGSLIKSYPEGKTLFESFVKKKHVKKALDYVKQYTLNVALCHADAIYYTEENYIISQLMEKFGAKYEQVDSYEDFYDKTLEISIAGDNKNSMKYIWERMSFPYSIGLKSSYFKSHRHDNIYYVEIRRKNASKGSGMVRLLKYLKIKPEEAAVVGDWYNDISLFRTKAYKVALANAVPEIKRMSDIITEKSNNEDGASEFLEKLLKAKRG